VGWAHFENKTNSYIQRVTEDEPVRKRPLGRPLLRWEDKIKKGCRNSIVPKECWK